MWAGRRPFLTWVSWDEESKRIPMSFLKAGSARTELTWPLLLAPGCTTQSVGPQLLNFPVGHWDRGLTTHLPGSPSLLGATHHDLGSLAPWPSHPHLHVHLPAREEDRALLCNAPLQFHTHGASALPLDGICDQGKSGPGSHLPFLPIMLSHWPGWALGEGSR